MKEPKCSVGVLGHGRFGSMAVQYLSKDRRVRWHDPQVSGGSTLQETVIADVVLLCIPIRSLPKVCEQIAPLLRPGQLVVDTCSVKVQPIRWMLEMLPESVDIVGTHPLFGPDSGRNGIEGLKIALCPARGARAPEVGYYLKSLGLRVVQTTPEQHDREMAETQAVFHLISRAILNTGLSRRELSTPGPELFFELLDSLQHDSMELFLDLESENQFTPGIRRRLIQALIDLDQEISARESEIKRSTDGQNGRPEGQPG